MPTYPAKGSAGPAATPTVWMSPFADKFTIGVNKRIFQQSSGGGTFFPFNQAVTATLFANNMCPNNVSFGALTTAPDGTSTAVHVVEDTSNNLHSIDSGILTGDFSMPNCYMAGIFKADTRTRIAFGVINDNGNGIATGFDLFGGQIAYTGAAVNFGDSTINILSQDITSLGSFGGGGFYLCRILWNCTAPNVNFGILGNIVLLDNGSGTGAASLTYTGIGSGVIGWKMSTMPPQAWAMAGNQVFLDHFTDPTLANVDKNNTFTDGFDWYLNNFVSGYLASQPLTSANLVQSGSNLTINPQLLSGVYTFGGALSSWGNPGDGRAHGAIGRNVYALPAYFEVKAQFPYGQRQQSEVSISFFQTVEFCDELSRSAHVTGAPPYIQGDGSIRNWNIGGWAPTFGDCGDAETNFSPQGITGTNFITQINPALYTLSASGDGHGSTKGAWGISEFTTNQSNATGYFNTPAHYAPLSQFYYNTANNTTLPGTATWNVYTYPAGVPGAPSQPAVFVDQTTFHTYAVMMVPYDRVGKNHGCWVTWIDGICTGIGQVWSPTNGGDLLEHTFDWQRIFWSIQTGFQGATWGYTLDYVKVVQ